MLRKVRSASPYRYGTRPAIARSRSVVYDIPADVTKPERLSQRRPPRPQRQEASRLRTDVLERPGPEHVPHHGLRAGRAETARRGRYPAQCSWKRSRALHSPRARCPTRINAISSSKSAMSQNRSLLSLIVAVFAVLVVATTSTRAAERMRKPNFVFILMGTTWAGATSALRETGSSRRRTSTPWHNVGLSSRSRIRVLRTVHRRGLV